MTLRTRLLRILVIIILTPVIFLLSCQSKLIYHPRGYDANHLGLLKAAKGERITYQTTQGVQTAFYIPPQDASAAATAPLWLCFSGNGSLALEWLYSTRGWSGNFAYLLIDYPSYGDCAGNPTPSSIRQSSVAAFDALALRLNTTAAAMRARSCVIGHSLGAAAALMAAEDLDLKRGVLISPFTSMTDMGRGMLGWPLCHLNLHRFNNRKHLARISQREGARFTLFHGSTDEVIPVSMGRELAAAHPDVVTYHEIPAAHHNDILGLIEAKIEAEMAALSQACE